MTNKKTHSDQKYIKALVENDPHLIREIYEKFVPKVIGFVCKNNGDEMRARDIVQEALVSIYDQAKTKDLELTCPFDAFFFLVCKRKWYNALKKKANKGVTLQEERLSIVEEADEMADENRRFEGQQNLYLKMLSEMGETCKRLITLGLSSLSMKEVAEKLNITYAYARKKKSICLSKLTALIQSHPDYEGLKNL